MFPAIALDQVTGNTLLTSHEALGYSDETHTSPVNIPKLYAKSKLIWLYAEEVDSLLITMNLSELIGYKYLVHHDEFV